MPDYRQTFIDTVRDNYFTRNPDDGTIIDNAIGKCADRALLEISRRKPRKDISGVATFTTGDKLVVLPDNFMSASFSELYYVLTGNRPLSGNAAYFGALSIFDSEISATDNPPQYPARYRKNAGPNVPIRLTTNDTGAYCLLMQSTSSFTGTRDLLYEGFYELTSTKYTLPRVFQDIFLNATIGYMILMLDQDILNKSEIKRAFGFGKSYQQLAQFYLNSLKQMSPLGFRT